MTQRWKFTGDSATNVPALGLTGVAPGTVLDLADEDIAVAAGIKGAPLWECIDPPPKAVKKAAKAVEASDKQKG